MVPTFDESPSWANWEQLAASLAEGSASAAEAARVTFVAALDSNEGNVAEDAQAILERHPDGVLAHLLEQAPGFGCFGCLCAIELLIHIGSKRAEPALIDMLHNRDAVVRGWAADALVHLGSEASIPPLRSAYERWRTSGTPPDLTEPTSIRRALTAPGARTEVLSEGVARSARRSDALGRYWHIKDLANAVNALAGAGHVITSLTALQLHGNSYLVVPEASPTFDLDYAMPWHQLVEVSREEALSAPRDSSTPDLAVTIDWITQADT